MRTKKAAYLCTPILILLVLAALTAMPAAAQVESILHDFGSNTKAGVEPDSALTFDSAGNFYGTAATGGNQNVGVVFEFSPKTGGGWTEKVLYSFLKTGGDGQNPADGLIFDTAGNLYGKTTNGGSDNNGTIFELSPPVPPNTHWTETILHSFGTDGQGPRGKLVFDASGNLYGVAGSGGTFGAGMAFELSPAGGGSWNETVLHEFTTSTGWLPSGGLIFDASGNLYGVTGFGGSSSDGVVFELSPASGGDWTYTVLHNFAGGSDGSFPQGGLIFDSTGNLYGATAYGDPEDNGTVFELSPSSGGAWTVKILHNFEAAGDGYNPNGTLAFNSAGALFGTTLGGGTGTCSQTGACGIVYELELLGGAWHEKILHDFNENGTDGFFPTSGVTLNSAGDVYGTTEYGGTFDNGTIDGGTVYTIRP